MSSTLDQLDASSAVVLSEAPAPERQADKALRLHITWVNQHAALTGGAEHYIYNTVRGLNERGVRNTLLYDVDGEIAPQFTQQFAEAYPMVDVARQLVEMDPDVVYAHRVETSSQIEAITSAGPPSLRFFHDHKLFCLREHKYTTLRHQTCTQKTGLGCYACLGFLGRSESWPGVRLRTLGSLEAEQRRNQAFDGYVVGSPYMADHVAEHGFDESRIHTLPLYAPEPKCGKPAPRAEGQFLFAGALLRGKGLDVLLNALARMEHAATLVVAGSGRQEGAYREQVKTLDLEDRVQFVGRLTPDSLADHLQTATCVVAPSRSPETFGLSGLEAFSYGAPVIASEVGGMGAWLKHEVNGLFVPSGDVDALTQAMDRVVGDRALQVRLGEAARRDYQEHFTPERHVDRLLDQLQNVAKRRS